MIPARHALLAEAGLRDAELELLAGDASTRRYHRARAGTRSAVLMDTGKPLAEAEPFLLWQAFLTELGIRVPRVLGVDRAAGLVLLEDLGDELLERRVHEAGSGAAAPLYRVAVDWGRRLADVGTGRFAPDPSNSDDPLVASRLAWEMDFFLRHAVPDERAGETTALADARRLLHQLCDDVHEPAAGRLVLCHRDYHSRNLLVVPEVGGETLAVIDFQDTRRGPRAYDVASLVHDPYVTLPEELARELIEAWRPASVDPAGWQAEVDLAAGQRLVKAAGTYAFQARVLGRHHFEQWLAPALERADRRLAGWPGRAALREALAALGVAR